MGSLSFEIKPLYKNLDYQQDHELDAVIKISAPEAKSVERQPLEIVACVDVSGSMAGPKIDMVQRSLRKLVEHLSDRDRLGIVTFTTDVERLAALAPMSQENKVKFTKLIDSMCSLASTNFSGGLVESLQMMKGADAGVSALRRILMFTDGLANVGVSDLQGILKLEKGLHVEGVAVTCFGYGPDHDAEMLQSLARQSGGNFYYAEDPDKILHAFANELGGLLSTTAQSLKITLSAQPGVAVRQVYNDLTVVPVRDGVIQVGVGDVLAGSTIYVALGLDVKKRDKKFPRPVLLLQGAVDYVDVQDQISCFEKGIDLKMRFVKGADVDKTVNKEVEEHVLLQKSVRAELEAKSLAQSGDFQAAQLCMVNFASVARGAGYDELAADMVDNAGLYASHNVFATTAGRRSARCLSKSAYKASGVEVRCIASSGGTQAQRDMVSCFVGDHNVTPNIADKNGTVAPKKDDDEDDEKSSKSVSVTGQRRSGRW